MNITIVPLRDYPSHTDQIAGFASKEFGLTKDFYLSSFKEAKTFLALHHGILAGFICIDKEDLNQGKYKQINNWLADLYVLEPFRRKGIASKLVDRVIQENGENNLFLWTEHEELLPFYIKKGFKIDEIIDGHIYIMVNASSPS